MPCKIGPGRHNPRSAAHPDDPRKRRKGTGPRRLARQPEPPAPQDGPKLFDSGCDQLSNALADCSTRTWFVTAHTDASAHGEDRQAALHRARACSPRSQVSDRAGASADSMCTRIGRWHVITASDGMAKMSLGTLQPHNRLVLARLRRQPGPPDLRAQQSSVRPTPNASLSAPRRAGSSTAPAAAGIGAAVCDRGENISAWCVSFLDCMANTDPRRAVIEGIVFRLGP